MARNLIAFCGPIGAGKSTAAKRLDFRHHYHILSFAAPIRNMIKALGLEYLDFQEPRKSQPHHLLSGRTPRQAMQTLGTEWGRNQMGSSFWVDRWVHTADLYMRSGGYIVVDDLRHSNEADAIRARNGLIIRIEPLIVEPVAGGVEGHSSEGQQFECDVVIKNDKTSMNMFLDAVDAVAMTASTV